MGKKRKRASLPDASRKRVKPTPPAAAAVPIPTPTPINHPVLSYYYPRVLPLRAYLLELLPASSRSRSRKIASLALTQRDDNSDHDKENKEQDSTSALAKHLDTTLVGVPKPLDDVTTHSRHLEFATFTQSQFRWTTGSAEDGPMSSQSEIIDFAIINLFRRNAHAGNYFRPSHLLCHGFQRAAETMTMMDAGHSAVSGIPGIVPRYPNKNVSMLKNFPWTGVLGLLGRNGEEIMLHLVLDCGLFVPVEGGKGRAVYQLSGVPLVELQPQVGLKAPGQGETAANQPIHSPGDIIFVRRRMFYARAALNAKGRVRFGLRHIHVLNRYPDSTNLDHTVHIMKYIFPRQFGLHNVFTSTVDRRETVQPFKDYTLREEEISRVDSARKQKSAAYNPSKLPKRLRGQLICLIQKLQKRHKSCAYVELLRYYCPVEKDSPTGNGSMFNHATPVSSVSAFCRAVLRKLVPNDLFGSGDDGASNRERIMRYVDIFIQLGRYESLSLHEVSQGLKITAVQWLHPPLQRPGKIVSSSDLCKRTEIFLEFIYYIFDSLLIPLIRSNFYVTESGIHRNRIFYFRHDVWRRLSEPSLHTLKTSLFEEVKPEIATSILSRRSLGFANLRLLPKAVGVRPIVNLRRRPVRKVARGWKIRTELGPSINSLMAPVASVLDYERALQPEALGSAMATVRDVHGRLEGFKENLERKGKAGMRLYFVKLDVQACFDTIPQRKLMELVERLVGEDEYRVSKHVEVKPPVGARAAHSVATDAKVKDKPRRKFVSTAAASSDFVTLYDSISREDAKTGKMPDTVFVDTGFQKKHNAEDLLALLAQHIGNNLVKIGKKFFRQRNGIPQGSVVSALLCNFFYGEHEKEELGFLREKSDEAVLMRLIDDYLLITTDRALAQRFLQTMLDGNPEYGIAVSPGKTLVNFDATTADGQTVIRRLPRSANGQFPYVGLRIDTRSLAISKEKPRYENDSHSDEEDTKESIVLRVADTLTVERSKNPGQTFHRKLLTAFRLQLHDMFVDVRHNTVRVAMRSLFVACVDCAMKAYVYVRRLRGVCKRGRGRRDGKGKDCEVLLMRIIADLIRVAVCLVHRNNHNYNQSSPPPSDSPPLPKVSPRQITWLAATAFKTVLRKKQTGFAGVLSWLDAVARSARPVTDREAWRLGGVVRGVI